MYLIFRIRVRAAPRQKIIITLLCPPAGDTAAVYCARIVIVFKMGDKKTRVMSGTEVGLSYVATWAAPSTACNSLQCAVVTGHRWSESSGVCRLVPIVHISVTH